LCGSARAHRGDSIAEATNRGDSGFGEQLLATRTLGRRPIDRSTTRPAPGGIGQAGKLDM